MRKPGWRTVSSGVGRLCALAWIACSLVPTGTRAEANAYVPVQSDLLLQGRPAEGLLILRSGYRNSSWLDVDALVFVGANEREATGDVLAISLGIREPHGYGHARLGRFLLSTGAVRPVQIDGASLLARPWRSSSIELFGGVPVLPEFAPRNYDWLVGGRAAQRLFERLTLGASYLHRRHAGELDGEELGADVSLMASDVFSVSGLGSWDLISHGLAELRLAAALHTRRLELELHGSRRIAARLLPATSLFSVISNVPSTELGAALTWHLFPRLDLASNAAALGLDGRAGYRAALRVRLRLSDEAGGEITAEGLRQHLGDEGYTGGSLRVQAPVVPWLRPHASIEVVAADHPRARGTLWPWARVGASYTHGAWLVSAAAAFRATPQYRGELQGLLRIAYAGEVQP